MKPTPRKTSSGGRATVQPGDRQTVQRRKDPAAAVQSPSTEAVQPGAVHVEAQVFRAKLKQYLDGIQPVIVGGKWHPRAIVIPVQWSGYRFYTVSAETRAEIMRRVEVALEALER